MRKASVNILAVLVCIAPAYAQNYEISFAGTGASGSVDLVKVENLTQCTELSIAGNDTLLLSPEVGMNESDFEIIQPVNIYPNPANGHCFLDFDPSSKGSIVVSICDLRGRSLFRTEQFVSFDHHTFKLTGLGGGLFLVKIESEGFSYSTKLISTNDHSSQNLTFGIEALSSLAIQTSGTGALKASQGKSFLIMQYNEGDLLKLTGTSGIYHTVHMLIPVVSQTVTFTFIPCTDADGNNYSVVQIGDQWWMAENLNAGTYVPITTPQAAGTKFCMNINGQDDPSCPMGGLYEWNVLMQEALPCNGTGAPPNDRCASPVKGLCPDGWHIPSHYEWTTLAQNAGSNFGALDYSSNLGVGVDEGGPLKLNCNTYWWNPNAGATNATGFSGIPGGDTWNGVFEDFGQSSYYWTSSAIFTYTYNPWVYALNYSVPFVGRSQYFKENGFSCRCVKD